MGVLSVYRMYACQNRVSVPLKLELQMMANHYVGAGN